MNSELQMQRVVFFQMEAVMETVEGDPSGWWLGGRRRIHASGGCLHRCSEILQSGIRWSEMCAGAVFKHTYGQLKGSHSRWVPGQGRSDSSLALRRCAHMRDRFNLNMHFSN